MKRTTKILLIAGTAAVLGSAAVIGTVSAQGRGGDGWRGYHSGSMGGDFMRGSGQRGDHMRGDFMGGGMGGGLAMMEQFDVNKDGNLTQEEIDQSRKDRLAKFDANKDGKLSLQEFEPLWLDFTRQQMVRAFQRLDADGDAAVTQDEYQRPTQHMVMRGDRNSDGHLNREDIRRFRGAPPATPKGESK